ncbi:MAG: tRNA pseudouridine(55) synthase TruB [Phycisphaerae bacterium]
MDGIILIDKPERMSSHHVLVRLRYGGFEIDKIGHGGTLDPLATGLLVVMVGRAVKLSEYVTGHDKTYTVTGILGKMRSTFDEEGPVIAEDNTPVTRGDIEKVLSEFPSEYEQMPPAFSAIKISGVAAYKHAREGKAPELTARTVKISPMELIDFHYPRFDLRVTVSAGTYIRSLIVDIAQSLGTLAYVGRLRRIASGRFLIAQSHPISEVLTWSKEQFQENLLPMEEAVMDFPAVDISPEQAKVLVCGQWLKEESLTLPTGQNPRSGKMLFRIRCNEKFIALGFFDAGHLKSEKVLLRW